MLKTAVLAYFSVIVTKVTCLFQLPVHDMSVRKARMGAQGRNLEQELYQGTEGNLLLGYFP